MRGDLGDWARLQHILEAIFEKVNVAEILGSLENKVVKESR